MRLWLVALLVSGLGASVSAQPALVELQQSAGTSSEAISGAGTQLRVFGEPFDRFRFKIEGAWGTRSDKESDVFGTAYPYGGEFDLIEAYGEYWLLQGRGLRAIKAGRYRTPFGISAAGDDAYLGFLRPPLVRYGEYFALSNGYLEHGLDLLVGVAKASVELSVGRPADVGEAIRRPGVDTVVRAQGVAGPLVVGASFLRTTPYLPASFAKGAARFAGVDARWMQHGVQLRGEWLVGRPFDGTTTTGGYVDLIVHRPSMGAVTAMARAERLSYEVRSPYALYTHRYSAGARIRLPHGLSTSVGVAHQGGQLTQSRRTALDVGVSYSIRYGR